MKLVETQISIQELKTMSEKMFGDIVKAVVDIEQEVMVVDADFHADEETFLLERGSLQKNLWGINFHPTKSSDQFLEFDSMINMRPSQGNRSRGIDNIEIQERIRTIINKLVIS